MDEIFNEQVKSTCAWLNQLATGVIVVGGLTPAAGLYYGLYNLRPGSETNAAIAFALAAGGMLRVAARDILGMLRT
jgi:zinc transporter ZupT